MQHAHRRRLQAGVRVGALSQPLLQAPALLQSPADDRLPQIREPEKFPPARGEDLRYQQGPKSRAQHRLPGALALQEERL